MLYFGIYLYHVALYSTVQCITAIILFVCESQWLYKSSDFVHCLVVLLC